MLIKCIHTSEHADIFLINLLQSPILFKITVKSRLISMKILCSNIDILFVVCLPEVFRIPQVWLSHHRGN